MNFFLTKRNESKEVAEGFQARAEFGEVGGGNKDAEAFGTNDKLSKLGIGGYEPLQLVVILRYDIEVETLAAGSERIAMG